MTLPAFPLSLRAAAAVVCAAASASADDLPLELDWRLVDKAIDPPAVQTPDWSESGKKDRKHDFPAVAKGVGGAMVSAARQPAGALSGRIVFTNGGHGWIYDPNRWRLQRPILHEMNEDCGNADQKNLFASLCFNAGAVVVPMRPLGYQPREVVMDNDDPGVTFAGTWFDSTSSVYFGSPGDVPYRYAALSTAESATATYTPTIPAAGFYPVYTWVRSGSDRGDQLYRIRHTGGETQLRIPHHMVGLGWVYLGEYYFNAGADSSRGAVVVSNLRANATGDYTFADAIRFGNGMGSINRGGGVSGYPREDEGCRYWIQTMIGQGQPSSLYDGGGNDESDGWSAPAKMSAEMNREQAGDMFDRIHISFHSNASGAGARGALALITGDPTPNQSVLAQLCGAEVNNDLVALGSPPLEIAWSPRASPTYTGGYSEIDGSYFNYEMDATIIEVGFHDSEADARLLRDPTARAAIAKAALHAVIRYFSRFDGLPLVFPPDAPSGLRAAGRSDGQIDLTWNAPVATSGSGSPGGYVIYRSQDGFGFGSPITVSGGGATSATIAPLAPGEPCYFRVATTNPAGESFPSETVACLPPSGAESVRALVVNAFDRFDRTINLRQDLNPGSWDPPGATGAVERVMPRSSNSFAYTVSHAAALAAAGAAVDSCQNEAVAAGDVDLGAYTVLVWACGQESTADETFSAAEQNAVRRFRAAGGHVVVSGSEIAWDLDRTSGPSAADRSFIRDELHAMLASDADDHAGSFRVAAEPGSIFAGMPDIQFDAGTLGIYPVQRPDVLTPTGSGAAAALRYIGGRGGAAAVAYDGSAGGGRTVAFGFPFETIAAASARADVMTSILTFFDSGEVLVAAGSFWSFEQSGADLGEAWREPGFADGAWQVARAQFGFGESDEATALDPDPLRTTTYFRHVFTAPNARDYSALRLRLLCDDGAVVWLNGMESARFNMPDSGPIAWSTMASTAISGAAENVFVDLEIDPRILVAGLNTLAVEVHQFSTSSSDLSFDLELSGAAGGGTILIPSGSAWWFRDTGIPPPATWTSEAFDDSGWASGPARLGYGGDGETTVVSEGPDPNNVHPATWFRRRFDVADAGAFDALRIDLQRDDGAMIWLNGSLVARDNMPAGHVSDSVFAAVTVGGADEQAWQSITVPATALLTGSNVVAVRIHQTNAASSDIGFDLRLAGLAQAPGTFELWRAANFGSNADDPVYADPLADPNGNGIPSVLEYAVGASEGAAEVSIHGRLPAAHADESGRPAVTFTRSSMAIDLTLVLQGADSPHGPWTNLAISGAGNGFVPVLPGVEVVEDTAGALRAVTVSEDFAPMGRRFYRLLAVQ